MTRDGDSRPIRRPRLGQIASGLSLSPFCVPIDRQGAAEAGDLPDVLKGENDEDDQWRWKYGDTVPWSGIYRVQHAGEHTYPSSRHPVNQQVICRAGGQFPRCNQSGDKPLFTLVGAGDPVEETEFFR